MPPEKWGETRNVAWVDFSALRPQRIKHFLQVNCIPVCDSIECKTEGTQLLFLPLFECVAGLTPIAVMDFSGKFMAKFLLVELDENTAPEIGVINVIQDMQGLDEPP